MHDLSDYETRGIPTVMVASSEFVDAAERQSRALGMPDLATQAVFVPHPIQDATDEEMKEKAREAYGQIMKGIAC